MKKAGIINRILMGELTSLGHGDTMVICDAGYPVPADAKLIDLSLTYGTPTFFETLKAVLNEVIFQDYCVFEEMKEWNAEDYKKIENLLQKLERRELPTADFNKEAAKAKFFVRTGELRYYSNIILTSASGTQPAVTDFDICCD